LFKCHWCFSINWGGIGIGYGIPHRKQKESKFIEKAIPFTGEYYQFNNNKITGFSQNVVANPSLLSSFNTLDLNNKDIDGNASFSPRVFNEWKCLKISLASTKFHFDSHGRSGYEAFADSSLSSVIELDLTGADFASSISTDLPSYTGYAYTASYTFIGAIFSSLTSLDLSGAVFAVGGMTTSGSVYTAHSTFNYAIFSSLTSLDLTGAVFVADEMATSGDIGTASSTFYCASFTTLTSLDLSGAVFAVGEMTTSGNVNTASSTFASTRFPSLTTLNLSGAVFAASGMTSGNVNTASNTFNSGTIVNLSSLCLPQDQSNQT
jgi:hypothetical protein